MLLGQPPGKREGMGIHSPFPGDGWPTVTRAAGLDPDGVVCVVHCAAALDASDIGQVRETLVPSVAISPDGERVVSVVTGTIGSGGTSVGGGVDIGDDRVTKLLTCTG